MDPAKEQMSRWRVNSMLMEQWTGLVHAVLTGLPLRWPHSPVSVLSLPVLSYYSLVIDDQ